ncbi:hypothetical protein ACFWGD_03310 [Corynebacterium sp. NPDC060344]|uniref:biotin synthase auxiliary protein BsaP n=1 Tax=Corynebacterium sp. NPDC060344 TaxID=3347101 RepID=UPI003668FB7A
MAATAARRGANPDSKELLRATLLGDPPEYDPFTGAHLAEGERRPLSYSARAGLEAPRYCRLCGRRMVVQVRPDGWSARCSRHGELDSAMLDRR